MEQQLLALESSLTRGEKSKLQNISATVAIGKLRYGHGLEITLRAVVRSDLGLQFTSEDSDDFFVGELELHGSSFFNALPYGIGHIAKMLLPYKLKLNKRDFTRLQANQPLQTTFTIGAKSLAEGRILDLLRNIERAGDEPFVLELRGGKNRVLLGFIATKASLIRESLRRAADVSFVGPLPRYERRKRSNSFLWSFMLWVKFPVLFTATCWMLCLHPQKVLSAIPPIVLRMLNSDGSRLQDLLPLSPRSLSEAFQLGSLYHQLTLATENQNSQLIDALLRTAEALVGRQANSITADQLLHTLDEIKRLEAAASISTRVYGLFSFVNFVWAIAILGIAVSIGPSIYHLLYPLRKFLKFIVIWLYKHVIKPVARCLHQWGVFELILYALTAMLVVEGARRKQSAIRGEGVSEDVGFFLAFTGALVSFPLVGYSTFLWGLGIVKSKFTESEIAQLFSVWVILTWIPLAIMFTSSVFAYGVVMSFWSLMGFSVVASNLCIALGMSCRRIISCRVYAVNLSFTLLVALIILCDV